jgi:translocation and assembly module TamB
LALSKLLPPESLPALPNVKPLAPDSPIAVSVKAAASGETFIGNLSFYNSLARGDCDNFRIEFGDKLNLALKIRLYPGPAFGFYGDGDSRGLDLDFTGGIKNESSEIERLVLKGEGFLAEISGQADPKRQTVNLSLDLKKEAAPYEYLSLLAPSAPIPGELKLNLDAERDPASEALKAKGSINLTELKGIAPDFYGPVEATFDLKGPLNDLKLNLAAKSPELKNPAGTFEGVDLKLNASYLTDGAAKTGSAEVNLSASGLGTPLNLTAAADVKIKPGEFSVKIANLDLLAPGVTAKSQNFALALAKGRPPDASGEIAAQVVDWALLGRLTGLKLAGDPASLKVKIESEKDKGLKAKGPKAPLGEAILTIPDLKAGDFLALKAVNLTLTATLADEAKASLELTQGPGRIDEITLNSGSIKATGAGLWREGLAGDAAIRFTGPKGDLLAFEGSYDLKGQKAVVKKLYLAPPQIVGSISLNRQVAVNFANGVKFEPLTLTFSQGGQLSLEGSVGGSGPLNAKIVAKELPINLTAPEVASLPTGRIDLTADYQEGGAGSFNLKSTLTGPPRLNVAAKGTLNKGSLRGEAALDWPNSERPFKASFNLPLKPAGQFVTLNQAGPVEIDAAWSGPAGRLWSLTGLEDMALRGQFDLKAKIRGSVAKPKTELAVYLAKGGFQDPASGLSLTDLNLSGRVDENGEIRILVEAGDGGRGRLALAGAISPNASPPSIKARAHLESLSPLHRDDLTLTASAIANLEGPFNALKLTAKAVIEKGEFSLAQGFGGAPVKTLDLGEGESAGDSPLTLDLNIEALNQFYIRGRGLDSEWQVDLKLKGPANRPSIEGFIRPVRGYLELLSKQFTISRGEIRFFDSPVINPALNLELTRQASEILAVIRVSGTKDSPVLSLESQPPRPADEVLSQILFSKTSSQLSRMETLQLANSLKSLTGVGPKMDLFAPLNAVRDTLGLSVLRFGETSAGGSDQRILKGNSFRDNLLDDESEASTTSSTIEAGKYISDRVYVGLEQDLGKNSTGVRVEVELTPNLNLESKTTSQSSRVGLGWKKDY